MICLKLDNETDTTAIYQFYKYNQGLQDYEPDIVNITPCNINGKDYTPVNGQIIVQKDIISSHIDNKLYEMHSTLESMLKDQRRIFMLLMEQMGWWG